MTRAPDSGPSGLLEELRWRGMLHDFTPSLEARLASGRLIAGYNGFDPSGASLHIGHLVPIFGLLQLQRHGGRPVALVGGATGMIGDPSGSSAERNLLDRATLESNVASIRSQLERFLDFTPGSGQAELVNNLDWLGRVSMLDFLRDVGKHFTIPYMLAKDSVQLRLDRGLSYTEFSYMLLQSADFLHLYRERGVELQMGGADQWGNITAGLELIRRVEGGGEGVDRAYALAYPLLLNPSGDKFGKTASGESVWLDPARTSPFAFYQHWLNTDDRDVGVYLRWFTLLAREVVEGLQSEAAARPEARTAQRALAHDITSRVHGEEQAQSVEAISAAIFSNTVASLDVQTRAEASRYLPTATAIPSTAFATGLAAAQIAVASNAVASLSEVRRLIRQGGLYIEDRRVTDPDELVELPADRRLFLRIGKQRYVLVPIADE